MSDSKIAQRMQEIPFSSIRTVFERVNQLEREGHHIIHLEQGKPDFDTPEHIKQATQNAIDDGAVHYTSNYGILPLRQAIANKLANENQLHYDPERELIVTTGVTEGIMMSMMALLNPGDEVLIPEPVFPLYLMTARMAGAVPVTVPVHKEHDYIPQVADLQAKVTERTKMLVIITPGNPTGIVLAKSVLEALAEFAITNDLLVMSDEIYEKLIYDQQEHVSIASLPGMRDRTLTLNGFSKGYAMTGWRLGYVAGCAKLIDALVRIHQNSVVCGTSFAQWGALAALEGTQEPAQRMLDEFARRRQLVIEHMSEIPQFSFPVPQGAMYLYINVEQVSPDANQLAQDLLTEAHVAAVPWNKQHIRISYGNNVENLTLAMQRIKAFMEKITADCAV